MRKNYPIGLQSFRKIREGNYLYVDKTEIIHHLVSTGGYYFLSRPRRFGKSLLVDIIEELFSGSPELFKGLWIEDRWNWEHNRRPVIRFSFANLGVRTLGLENAIFHGIAENAQRLGIKLSDSSYDQQFSELIQKASRQGRVVILIDEYDKPIIDYLDDLPMAEKNREIFKSFYSILKDADNYIHFLMITGVSRFTKVSIFSDLNHLRDISLAPDFSTLVGITQTQLEDSFQEEIAEMKTEEPEIIEKIRRWYNGYSWNGIDKVYNPFSLLNFMADRTFGNYWFETGTPTFLVKQIREQQDYNFEGVRVSRNTLGKFDVRNLLSIPLLFQTGYLTIKAHDKEFDLFELGYPNKEVEISLLDNLLGAYREIYPADSAELTADLVRALKTENIDGMVNQLNALVASIPYDHWKAESESIFHIIVHLAFKRAGVNIQTEVHSAKGRCDALIFTKKHIYAIELKLDGNEQAALNQIFEKGYLDPYKADLRTKIAIGVNFSSEKREVTGYLHKKY